MQVFAVSRFDKGSRLILLIKAYATLLCDHTAQISIQLHGIKACIVAGLVTQDPDRELDIVHLSILGI